MQERSGPTLKSGSMGGPQEDITGRNEARNNSTAFAAITSAAARVPLLFQRDRAREALEHKGPAFATAANCFQIMTDQKGYNSGRKYCIQVDSEAERDEIITTLTPACKHAKKRMEARSRLQTIKVKLSRIIDSKPFQYFFAFLIVAVGLASSLANHPISLSLSLHLSQHK